MRRELDRYCGGSAGAGRHEHRQLFRLQAHVLPGRGAGKKGGQTQSLCRTDPHCGGEDQGDQSQTG